MSVLWGPQMEEAMKSNNLLERAQSRAVDPRLDIFGSARVSGIRAAVKYLHVVRVRKSAREKELHKTLSLWVPRVSFVLAILALSWVAIRGFAG